MVGVVLGWRWGGLSDSQIMLGIRSIANIIPNKLEVTKVNIIALLLLIITVQFWTFSGKITFYQFGGRIFIFQPTDLQDPTLKSWLSVCMYVCPLIRL